MIPLILLLAVGGLMHAIRSYTGGTEGGTDLAFGYLLLVAYFTGKIVGRIGMPRLTGYIIAGVVSGSYALNFVSEHMNESLKVVGDVAICLIALSAGSGLNLKKLRPVMGTLRSLAFYAVVLAQLVIAGVLFVLAVVLHLVDFTDGLSVTQALAACLVVGIALTAKSPAVVIALLAETGAEGPVSQVMLGSVVVCDFVVLIFYAAAATLATAVIGGGVDVVETSFSVVWQLLGSMVFGSAIGVLLGRYQLVVQRGMTLFAVMVCVVVAEIGTSIGLNSLIVMLAAGVYLENFSRAKVHDLLANLEFAQLPVFLVFFALAGGEIALGRLAAALIPVVLIVGARAATFFVGARAACARTGARPEVARFAWFGLLPQSGLALALALLMQRKFPSFGEKASVIVFGVVGINELISPVVLRAMIMKSGEAGRRQAVKISH